VLIHDFLELNPIENPNQAKAAAKLVDQVPTDSCVYGLVGRELRKYGSRLDPELLKRFEAIEQTLEIAVAQDPELEYQEESR